jgi:pyruvate/2-oxoglutarate dehydrogenase complex dihydrolipoamide acyltransferase (E2) component
MSLINQALRKAQRDRTPERMPTSDSKPGGLAGTASPGAPSASGFSPGLIVGLALMVAILIGLVVGLSIAIFKGDSNAPPAAQTNGTPTLETSTPTQLKPATPATGEPVAPQIIQPARSQTNAGSTTPNVVEELRRAREAAEAKAQAEAQAAAKAAAEAEAAQTAAEAEPNQAVIEWLGTSTISGVRLAGEASRVILNGEAFSVGEMVNFSLGLKVIVIQENRVLFEDSEGTKYMKHL